MNTVRIRLRDIKRIPHTLGGGAIRRPFCFSPRRKIIAAIFKIYAFGVPNPSALACST
jgi:hypothetical protein